MIHQVYGLTTTPAASGIVEVAQATGVELEHLLTGAASWSPRAFTRAFRGIGPRPEHCYAVSSDADEQWIAQWLGDHPAVAEELLHLLVDAGADVGGDRIEEIRKRSTLQAAILHINGFCSWDEIIHDVTPYTFEARGRVHWYGKHQHSSFVLTQGHHVAVIVNGVVYWGEQADDGVSLTPGVSLDGDWDLLWSGTDLDYVEKPLTIKPQPLGETLAHLYLDSVPTTTLAQQLGCDVNGEAISIAIADRTPDDIVQQRGVVVVEEDTDASGHPVLDAWWMYAATVGDSLYCPEHPVGAHRIDAALKYREHEPDATGNRRIVEWPDLFAG